MDIVASPTAVSANSLGPTPDLEKPQSTTTAPNHITIAQEQPRTSDAEKPPIVKHVSAPAYESPLRHHRRVASAAKHVKESLDARSEYVTSQDDGVAEHRINQYIVKQEIGRGSFGAVHLAVDQFGTEYAVKEFSKARLRKRAQSHILRTPRRGGLQGFNSPLHRRAPGELAEGGSSKSIDLIKEEIAIMKKLNHPNLVSLFEVLDDPREDSLYMVMEMCKKGVVMKVGLDQRADPYPDDACRYWFRDLILGIEYLHAQGVVHRDIKPDNCLITNDDVLKVVDFGVSEMFSKDAAMVTAKSAGSPAFLPPELCVAKHGDVSGTAADIWSMGVTLYCLKFGHIPFEKSQIFDLYESIKSDQPDMTSEDDEDFLDMMKKIFEKDPGKRIKMHELRSHPWVTKRGKDPLLSEAENTAVLVEPPTEAEMNAAITGNIRSLMAVAKAVNRFKALLPEKPVAQVSSFLGEQSEYRFVAPPERIQRKPVAMPMPHLEHKSHSLTTFDRDHREGMLVAEGVHKDFDKTPSNWHSGATLEIPHRETKALSDPPRPILDDFSTDSEDDSLSQVPTEEILASTDVNKLPKFRSLRRRRQAQTVDESGHQGQARDPLEEKLFLHIGPSTFSGVGGDHGDNHSFNPDDGGIFMVSESPGAADVDIYETAYRDEIERILAKANAEQKEPNVFLTRRVDQRLLAISGWAGKWMAGAEEAANNIDYYTQFSARRAKVAEVSKALRHAARDEYEKRRQEKRGLIAQAKTARAKMREDTESKTGRSDIQPISPDMVESPATMSPRGSAVWKGKAADKGRQARESLMGFVDLVKTKRRTWSKDEDS